MAQWPLERASGTSPSIDNASTVRKILDHIGESTAAAEHRPGARGAPLWEATRASEQAGNDPPWARSVQPIPEFKFDPRIAWGRAIFSSPWVHWCVWLDEAVVFSA